MFLSLSPPGLVLFDRPVPFIACPAIETILGAYISNPCCQIFVFPPVSLGSLKGQNLHKLSYSASLSSQYHGLR